MRPRSRTAGTRCCTPRAPPCCCPQAGVWSYTRIRTLLAVKAVPDILSQGGGRESGPWPRRVAAAAVLVLVAVTIVHYLPRSRHETARPVRVPVTVTPPPAVSGAVSGDAGVAEEPDGITGQVLSWPGGLRLPATGPRPAWFWPATGQVVPIGGLPLQRSGYQRTAAGGGQRSLQPRQRLPGGPGELQRRGSLRRAAGAAGARVPGQRPPDGRAANLGQQRRPGRLWLAGQQRQPGR